MKAKQSEVEGIHSAIRSQLKPGEQILWFGNAEPFQLLEADSRKAVLAKWILFLGGGAGLIIIYVGYCLGTKAPINALLVGMLAILAVFLASAPSKAKKKIESEEAYVITDQRVISMGVKTNMKELPRKGLKVKREKMQNGAEIILMGTACEKSVAEARHIALFGLSDKSGENVEGMAFYSVKDGKKISDLIEA